MKRVMIFLIVLCMGACSLKTTREEPNKPTAAPVEKKDEGALTEEKQAAEIKEKSALRQVAEEAQPIIENILQSINDDNYEQYVRDFNIFLRETYNDKQQFLRINKDRKAKIGEYVSIKTGRVEKKSPYYILYYGVQFSKAKDPIMVRLSLKRESG